MTARLCARWSRNQYSLETSSLRSEPGPADADDHVDAADGGARGRLRQAGDLDILARMSGRPVRILEEVMMVTDVGVEIGVAGIHHHLARNLPR